MFNLNASEQSSARGDICQEDRQQNALAMIDGKENHPAHRRENSSARKSITCAAESMVRARQNKLLLSDYRRHDGLESSWARHAAVKPQPGLACKPFAICEEADLIRGAGHQSGARGPSQAL
jgi:hypothetical protein